MSLWSDGKDLLLPPEHVSELVNQNQRDAFHVASIMGYYEGNPVFQAGLTIVAMSHPAA
jgi:hypothetical protein